MKSKIAALAVASAMGASALAVGSSGGSVSAGYNDCNQMVSVDQQWNSLTNCFNSVQMFKLYEIGEYPGYICMEAGQTRRFDKSFYKAEIDIGWGFTC